MHTLAKASAIDAVLAERDAERERSGYSEYTRGHEQTCACQFCIIEYHEARQRIVKALNALNGWLRL